jgi:hypothetical protein
MSYYAGQKVVIRKYGKLYKGTVVSAGRVRVTVEFRMVSGRMKTVTLSGYEVETILKAA